MTRSGAPAMVKRSIRMVNSRLRISVRTFHEAVASLTQSSSNCSDLPLSCLRCLGDCMRADGSICRWLKLVLIAFYRQARGWIIRRASTTVSSTSLSSRSGSSRASEMSSQSWPTRGRKVLTALTALLSLRAWPMFFNCSLAPPSRSSSAKTQTRRPRLA